MAVRTVRLDDDTEKILEQLVERTGMTISSLLKQGLAVLKDQLSPQAERTASEIYEELDLGPGGYAIASSTETGRGVQDAIRRKAQWTSLTPRSSPRRRPFNSGGSSPSTATTFQPTASGEATRLRASTSFVRARRLMPGDKEP